MAVSPIRKASRPGTRCRGQGRDAGRLQSDTHGPCRRTAVAETKIPEIVAGSSASITMERSPYIVRTLSTQAQITVPLAQWAIKNGIKRVITLVSDFAPGLKTEKAFIDAFRGTWRRGCRGFTCTVAKSDFAPFLQRARDAKPDAVFAWGLAVLRLRFCGNMRSAVCSRREFSLSVPAT